MSEDRDRAIFALLDDDYARAILTATSREPMSAKTLSEECDASLPTVYRRVERLEEHDLLVEKVRIASDGNHYNVYEANLDALHVDLDDGDLDVDVVLREDVADRFTRLWTGMRGE